MVAMAVKLSARSGIAFSLLQCYDDEIVVCTSKLQEITIDGIQRCEFCESQAVALFIARLIVNDEKIYMARCSAC